MKQSFEIDEIDVKILKALLKDTRSKLKDIAEDCELSSTAIKNRIEKMKTSGLIVRAVLNFNMASFEYEIALSIGMNVDPDKEQEVIEFIKNQGKVAGIDRTIGKYDLCLVVFLESINKIDELKYKIRKQKGVRNIELNIWSKRHFNFDNIDFLASDEV